MPPIDIRRARVGAEDAVDLPSAENRPGHRLRVPQPGQRIDEAHLQDVRPVEAGERIVQVIDQRAVVVETNPSVLVRHVLRPAQRVGTLQQQAVAERPVDGDLQAVIAALRARRPVVDRGGSRLREELARRVAAAGHAVVDVQVGVAAVGTRSDIRELGRDVTRPPELVGGVPLLDDAAVHLGPGSASGRRRPAAAAPGPS